MRKSAPARLLIAAAMVLLWAGTAHAQEPGLNRVADGDFEAGSVALSLPAVAQFPMFSGGWASRGARLPQAIDSGSFEGTSSLRLVTTLDDPVQLLQDVPLNSAAYGLRFAFLIESGVQTVRLVDDWDRSAPSSGTPAFAARLSAGAIVFTTPAGSWHLAVNIERGEWHALSVIADPRSGNQTVGLDGKPLVTLPGLSVHRPFTLILGGGADDSGTFRYDAVELISLVDLELSTIRATVAHLDITARDDVLDRLAAAGTALQRGSPALALPELAVARSVLEASAPATENLRGALTELIELLEASSDRSGPDLAARH
jgi:hypothetical protein